MGRHAGGERCHRMTFAKVSSLRASPVRTAADQSAPIAGGNSGNGLPTSRKSGSRSGLRAAPGADSGSTTFRTPERFSESDDVGPKTCRAIDSTGTKSARLWSPLRGQFSRAEIQGADLKGLNRESFQHCLQNACRNCAALLRRGSQGAVQGGPGQDRPADGTRATCLPNKPTRLTISTVRTVRR
jgi:hypothetical protein